MRTELGLKKQEAAWGEAPLNPSLIGPWSQEQQAAQQPEQPGPDMQSAEQAPGFGQDGNQAGDDGAPGENQGEDGQPGQQDQQADPVADPGEQPMQKAIPAAMLRDAAKQSDEASKPHPGSYGVGINDEVFFRHPQHGATSGKVLAYGADGFTAEHTSGRVGVPWDGLLGHKKRAERTLTQVEAGEGGSIVKDETTGRHHFLAGNASDMDDEDQELASERALILGDDQSKGKK
jgi:hypothetical protein